MKSRYTGYTDEELIVMLRDGDMAVTDFIMDKYKNLVKSKAKSMFIIGGEEDDLIQEGMIGLFKAVRDYDAGRDASFFTFADLCISRQMYNAVQASGRKKHGPLNSYVSLYAGSSDEDEEGGKPLLETLADITEDSPEKHLIERENYENLWNRIEEALSPFETQVLDLYLTGMGYAQIAKVLGRDDKSTDNALNRIKNKVKRLTKDEK
ncbi:MAG: sigma-70 family RNA polymerase sigma factor [Lachnospiraceae bacterium]|nr:sigma-70 family RNA polymerase sigma factor [Lachnospiraceae bacterium]